MERIAPKIFAILFAAAPFVFIGVVGAAFLAGTPQRDAKWLKVSPLSTLRDDGQPVRLFVSVPHYDAWTRLDDRPAGAIYARHVPATNDVRVVSAVHGKYRVGVDYDFNARCFRSQCFIDRFDVDGRVIPDALIKPSHYEDLKSVPAKVVDDILYVQWPSQ